MTTRLQGWVKLDIVMGSELARWQKAAPVGDGSFGAVDGSIGSIDIGQGHAHIFSKTIWTCDKDTIFER